MLAIPLAIILLSSPTGCSTTRHTKRARGFDQRSVGISDRSVVESEMVHADRAESSERSWTLPVGFRAS